MNFTNGLNMWEMTYICGKGLKHQRNDENMWKMTQICGKQLKYMGNVFDKRLKNVGIDLKILGNG